MTDIRQSAGESFTQETRARLSGAATPAIEQAKAAAEQQKAAGATKARALAEAVHHAADGLQSQLPLAASLLHEAAEGLERASTALDERSLDELIGEVGRLARRRPATVFGAAALAGFALSRFLKSSAESGSKQTGYGEGA
jgi:translation initiation factor 2B subunit (eIF-2B alpha/beta/delta family)